VKIAGTTLQMWPLCAAVSGQCPLLNHASLVCSGYFLICSLGEVGVRRRSLCLQRFDDVCICAAAIR